MLKERVATAVILIPLLLALLIWGNFYVLLSFLAVCVWLSCYESSYLILSPLLLGQEKPLKAWQASLTGLIGVLLFFLFVYVKNELFVIVTLFMLISLYAMMFMKEVKQTLFFIVGLMITLIYGSFFWFGVWNILGLSENKSHLFWFLAVIMLSDTGGYFFGLHFGKHKLSPLSPKKTWEGVFGGLFLSFIGAMLLNLFFSFGAYGHVAIISAITAILGVYGDLLESLFKRFSQVKDSGNIFPGHGGFLDRVDGIMFASPFFWFLADRLL